MKLVLWKGRINSSSLLVSICFPLHEYQEQQSQSSIQPSNSLRPSIIPIPSINISGTMSASPRIFVTGVSGYVGGHTVMRVIEKHPEWTIAALVRNKEQSDRLIEILLL